MVIKKATMMDFEEIHTIFEEVHDLHLQNTNKVFKNTDPLTKEEFKLALENENSFFLVAEEIKIIGFINAFINEKEGIRTKHKKTMHIEQLGVKKTEQQRGIGSKLIEEIKNIAKENNCDNIILDVWSFNSNAKKFYKNKGFKEQRIRMTLDL
jgi:ribosomal protein S18 acetylase RimI-like enzyme